MSIIRPWFPQSELFRAARRLLAGEDRSALIAELRDEMPLAPYQEIDRVLRAAAVEQLVSL